MKGEGISGGSEKFDANTDGLAIRDESESFDYVKASPEIHIDLTATDEKILKSELAKNVLPYLTLNELSEHEKAETLRLAGRVLDFTNMDYLNILKLKDSMHEISGTRPDSRPSDDIKLGETNKLFWGFFLEGLCTYENSSTEGIEIKALMPTVLWGKPFASYNCCGLEGQLELLSIAERSKNPLVKTIYKEIINEQASSKSDENIFQKILEDATPIKQLQMLPVMSNISNFYEDGDKKRERLHESLNGIVQTSGDPEFALKTILGIMTGFSSAEIDSLNLNLSDDKARSGIIDKLAKMKTNDEVMADKVADAFDYIQKNANSTPLVKIVAGELRRNDNNISPTEDPYYKRQAFKGFARQDADLLNTAHNPKIERVINSKLGTSLTDIPLASQVQLLKFMTEADNGRFDSLCSTLHGVKPELRLKLAEGFLAADFGEDFGDALLDIANSERITEEQLEKLLDQVKSCRESIAGITGLYEPIYKGEFAKQYARAANERLTDAIMVFREIAGKGQAEADLGWAGNVRLDYDEAMEALALEAKSLSTINGVMDDVRKGKEGCFAEMILSPDADHRRSYYNLYSPEHGYTLLYVRPEGSSSFDPTIEYGKYRSRYNEDGNNVGTEASISLIADPVDPFSQLNPFRPDRHKVRDPGYYDDDTMNKVSAIRLDREGRTPGAAADDPDRSPIAEEGMVSVDLAAIGDRFDTPSGKIARLVSAGNKIRQEANGHKSDFSLNHNVGWFDQDKYGKAGGFKEIAEYIDRNMRALCTLHPPKPGEGYAGEAEKLHRKELRAAQRERGRIAMRKFGQAA